MGVHLTFVRSVDLDEWTQRQIDAMRLGGNANARTFFRKHGISSMSHKIEKKYTSKAAVAYRAELEKLINAEAAKRGEAVATPTQEPSSDLLANLEMAAEKEQTQEAKSKLSAARSQVAVQPKATLASSMPGASKLSVKTGSVGMLRKPTTTSSNFLKKKKPMTAPRSGKLAVKLPVLGSKNTTETSDDAFGDVQDTPNVEEPKKEEPKVEEVAEKLDTGLSINQAATTPAPPVPAPVPAPVPVSKPSPGAAKKPVSMEQSMARLKGMTGDFFSGI